MVISQIPLKNVKIMAVKLINQLREKKMKKQLLILLGIVIALSGCAGKRNLPEEEPGAVEKQIKDFKMPETALPGKSLVYLIYRNDYPCALDHNTKTISFSQCNHEKFTERENKNHTANLVLNIFTLGALGNDSIATAEQRKIIGILNPGEYRTIQLDRGYYEIILNTPEKSCIVNLQPDKVYFVKISCGSAYNRYSKQIDHFYYISQADDQLGKFILSRNFCKSKN